MVRSRHSVPRIFARRAADWIWVGVSPKEMHFPMRSLVSESQRGEIAEGGEVARDCLDDVEERARSVEDEAGACGRLS